MKMARQLGQLTLQRPSLNDQQQKYETETSTGKRGRNNLLLQQDYLRNKEGSISTLAGILSLTNTSIKNQLLDDIQSKNLSLQVRENTTPNIKEIFNLEMQNSNKTDDRVKNFINTTNKKTKTIGWRSTSLVIMENGY